MAGLVSTAYLAGRAAYLASQIVGREEEKLERTQDPLSFEEKVKLTWKLYLPPAATGTITAAAIVSASRINSKRTAAYAAAYSLSETAFSEYRAKIKEQLGERKESDVRDKIAQDRVNNNPPDSALVLSSSGKVLCCELYTGRYFESDMESLRKAQNDINASVVTDLYVTLSDFYSIIGLSNTAISDEIGWDSNRLMELVFTTTLSTDSKPCLAFDYNYVKPI